MATKKMKVCDVSGTTNKVKTFRFSVFELGSGDEPFLVSEYQKDVDLCPASLKRGLKFTKRGVSPVPKKKESDTEEE